MSAHRQVIDGATYGPGDMVTDANGEVWKAYPYLSTFSNASIQWKTFGDDRAGSPRRPVRRLVDLSESLAISEVERRRAETMLVDHSAFAYPHFRLWHALFDGTRLCRCWRSREMRYGPPVIID